MGGILRAKASSGVAGGWRKITAENAADGHTQRSQPVSSEAFRQVPQTLTGSDLLNAMLHTRMRHTCKPFPFAGTSKHVLNVIGASALALDVEVVQPIR